MTESKHFDELAMVDEALSEKRQVKNDGASHGKGLDLIHIK